MPWVIEKKSADVQGNNVSATSKSGKVTGTPIRELFKSYLKTNPSIKEGRAILSYLLNPIQNLTCKITELLNELFDTRAQYRLNEDSNTDTAANAIAPDTANNRLSKESAYQQ